MKNLLRQSYRLDDVPTDILFMTQAKKADYFRHSWRRHWRGNCDHEVNGRSPYDIAEDIIEKFTGKEFDWAFSVFCSKVKKYQQHIFLDEFRDARRWRANHQCDDNGIIIRTKDRNKYRGPYEFRSWDCQIEVRHKETHHPRDWFKPVYQMQKVVTWNRYLKYYQERTYERKLLYYEYAGRISKEFPSFGNCLPLHKRYKAMPDDFEAVILVGFVKQFDSKQDPEYKRLMTEKRKQKWISEKKFRIAQAEKAYNMISQTKLKKDQEKEANKLKILAKGFDPIISFRETN